MEKKVILTVTKADRDLARLHLKIADKLGEPRDPRMELIAQAHRVHEPVKAEHEPVNSVPRMRPRSGVERRAAEEATRGL